MNPYELQKAQIEFNYSQIYGQVLLHLAEHFPYWVDKEIPNLLTEKMQQLSQLKIALDNLVLAWNQKNVQRWKQTCRQFKLDDKTPSTRIEQTKTIVEAQSRKILNYINHHLTETTLKEKLASLIKAFDHYHSESPDAEQLGKHLNETLQAFIIAVLGFKKGLIQKFGLNYLRSAAFQQKTGLTEEAFNKAKRRYQMILAYQKQLKSLSLQSKLTIPNHKGSQTWSARNDYEDLVFLCLNFDSDEIIPSLKRYQQQLKNQHRKRKNVLTELHNKLGQALPRCFKLQQAITLLQRWSHYLIQIKQTPGKTESAYLVYQLLTYDKKALLQQGYKEQNGSNIIFSLHVQFQQKDYQDRPAAFIKYLEQTKKSLLKTIKENEKSLTARYSHQQAIVAQLKLMLSGHPEYKLGELAARSVTEQMDHHPTLPAQLQEPLPPALQKKLEQATGTSFLILTLAGSYATGYYFHFYMMLSRIVLSQVNVYLEAAHFSEQMTQSWLKPQLQKINAYLPTTFQQTLDAYLASINPDEITVLGLDSQLNWLLGLGFNLLFSGMNQPTISIGAYIAATTGAYGVRSLTDLIADEYGISSNTTNLIKFIASSSGYLLIYSQAYQLGLSWQFEREKSLRYEEALDKFGFFNQQPSKKEIQTRYRELAIQYHPDKLLQPSQSDRSNLELEEGTTDDVTMSGINQAYDILTQKFQ